jgi:hypothetical protein
MRSIVFSLDRSVGNLQMTLATVDGAFDMRSIGFSLDRSQIDRV